MTIEIKVPTLGESVTEATVGQWFKKLGDQVTVDEPLVELETDKVTVEVPAPASGVLTDIMVEKGKTVAIGALLGALREGAGKAAAAAAKTVAAPAPSPAPAAKSPSEMPPAPAARKMMAESGISPEAVE
ncbi:MAG: biotin/lipoyl-containing protein, partial [Hyphomicrobium sp.]